MTTETQTPTADAPSDGAQTPAPPASGTQAAPTGTSGATVSMTREELDRQLAEARRTAERSVRESEELKTLRANAKRADDLEEAAKTEAEKLADRAAKAEAERDRLVAEVRRGRIEARFTAAALAAGIPPDRIPAALKLADIAAIEGDDFDRPIADAIKALPDWLKAGGKPAPDTNSGGTTASVSREQQVQTALAELRARGGDL